YNLRSLEDIILWNRENNINFFRIGSEIIPFASHEEFDFDWKKDFKDKLRSLKEMANETNMRFTMHPGQYTVLNSQRPEVVQKAIDEIEYHAQFLHEIYPDKGKIVIHTGGVYGDKDKAKKVFIKNFELLSELAKKMLILENDDKSYNVFDVLEISEKINIPVVFDILHHICNTPCKKPYENLEEIIEKVVNTWKGDIPIFHLSSRKGNIGCPHTEFIRKPDFNKLISIMKKVKNYSQFDIMVEAKAKEKAVIELLKI
ncbi:MAG: UV DNA damage repair endonuclease UvsE, partial [Candidatus Muiribacterium halophilum]